MKQPSVFWALVRKDLTVMRNFMIIAITLGLIGFVVGPTGKMGIAVGGSLFIMASLGSAISLAMFTVISDRKEQSRLFALSLPVSGAQHDRAKLVGAGACYGIIWLVLTAEALSMFLFVPGAPRGMVVQALLLQGFMLAAFALAVALMFVVASEGVAALLSLGVSVLFCVFIVSVMQPGTRRDLMGNDIIWTPFATRVLMAEAACVALAIGFVLYFTARRRDFL